MKITKQELTQLIKEELDTTLSEIAVLGPHMLKSLTGAGPTNFDRRRASVAGARAGGVEMPANTPAIGAPPSENIKDWEVEENILDDPETAAMMYNGGRVPTAGGQGYINLDTEQSELAPGERAQEDVALAASRAAPEKGMSYPSRAAQRMDQAKLADLRQQDQLAAARNAARIRAQLPSWLDGPIASHIASQALRETITKAVKEALTKKKV